MRGGQERLREITRQGKRETDGQGACACEEAQTRQEECVLLGLLSSFGAFLGPGFTAWPASGSCSEGLAEGQKGLGRRRFPTDDGHE